MKILYPLIAIILLPYTGFSQQTLTIPQIQGSGEISPYNNQTITTTGIVTAKYIGNGMINGFFLQDEIGDGNIDTSDGIFVYTTTDNVSVGDKIRLTAKVSEYYYRTQLSGITSLSVLSTNNTLIPTQITYDAHNWNWEKYEGMLIEFDQTLWVNNNYNLERYGELELGAKRKPIPTNAAFPNSETYTMLVNENSLPPIYLDDAYSSTYISPPVFADANGTRRMGERVTNLQAVVDSYNYKYIVYPARHQVDFYGNPRNRQHDNIGTYNLKVCGFNLEYYLSSPNSSGMGPSSQAEMNIQHAKILDAMLAIDADIYGLIEIEQGQQALTKLVQAMNTATGTNRYTFINDGGNTNGTYTKTAYLYRSDKVTPHKSLRNINSPSPINRKKMQAFTLNSNNERFILNVNHFKAKSGCSSATGANIDQNDGQSCFNATRVAEANAVISAATINKAYYEDDDVLIIGDLNSYAKEDPIQTFINAGYIDLLQQMHADSAYSYVYRTEAGYLDHAIANQSMFKQITGVTVFHINADESDIYGYSGNKTLSDMFRSSDHDPVIIGLALGEIVNGDLNSLTEKVKIYPSVVSEKLNVKEAENGYVQLFSLNGIKLYQNMITSSEYELDVKKAGLIPGAYIVRVLIEGRIVRQLIFIK